MIGSSGDNGDEEVGRTVTEETPLKALGIKTSQKSSSLTRSFGLSETFDSGTDDNVRYALWFVFAYFLVGIVAFTMVFEKWSIVDSIYFSLVTFSTVGYGDVYPSTDSGRLFCIFYSIVGITMLGIVLGEFGNALLDRQEQATKQSTDQMLELLRLDEDEDKDEDEDEDEEEELVEENFANKYCTVHAHVFRAVVKEIITHVPSFVVIIALAFLFGYLEQWTVIQSLYFAIVTSTTTGYGDIHPDTDTTKLLSLLFVPLAVGVMGAFLGSVADGIMSVRVEREEKMFLKRDFNITDFIAMDTDKDKVVKKGEFLAFLLVKMNKVDQETVDKIMELFDRLDMTKDGNLTYEDVFYVFSQKIDKSQRKVSMGTQRAVSSRSGRRENLTFERAISSYI